MKALEKRKIPVFGVCLGLQGMVEHYGGKLDVSARVCVLICVLIMYFVRVWCVFGSLSRVWWNIIDVSARVCVCVFIMYCAGGTLWLQA